MKNTLKQIICLVAGEDFLWKIRFLKANHSWPNLRNPTFFNEKIKHRIKYDQNYLYTKLSDKFQVRKYIEHKIGEEYLVPLRYVFDSEQNIESHLNFNDCVMKANHGAGMVKIINGEFNDIRQLREIARSWLLTDFSTVAHEPHYKNIPRKILIEDSLCVNGVVPNDYKFHTFKKKDGTFNVVLQLVNGRFGEESRGYYLNGLSKEDLVWHHGRGKHHIPADHINGLNKALNLSKILCEDFNYVRVDWYVTPTQIYFGELTFTSGAASGFEFGKNLEKQMCKFWEL